MRRIALWLAKAVLGCHHARMVGYRGGAGDVEVCVVGDLLLSPGALAALKAAHDPEAGVSGAKWSLETVESVYFVGRCPGWTDMDGHGRARTGGK